MNNQIQKQDFGGDCDAMSASKNAITR